MLVTIRIPLLRTVLSKDVAVDDGIGTILGDGAKTVNLPYIQESLEIVDGE